MELITVFVLISTLAFIYLAVTLIRSAEKAGAVILALFGMFILFQTFS